MRDIVQEIIDEQLEKRDKKAKKRELDIIKNLYRNGVSDEIILLSFGLTPEELEKIKAS